MKPWIISIDLDGILAKPISPDNYEHAQPIKENIEKVNRLFDAGHRIVIYTARGWHGYDLIERWLRRHGVKYSQIVCGKLYAHAYIDDFSKDLHDLCNQLL
jgi:hypothetical protein